MLFTSVMMFGAPGATNSLENILFVVGICHYPIVIGAAYWVLGASLFGIKGRTVFLITLIVVGAGVGLFGYYSLLFDALRGIKHTGYSLVSDKVYYDAVLLDKASPKNFGVFGEVKSFDRPYAKDFQHVF